jgi:hypothetical protein
MSNEFSAQTRLEGGDRPDFNLPGDIPQRGKAGLLEHQDRSRIFMQNPNWKARVEYELHKND